MYSVLGIPLIYLAEYFFLLSLLIFYVTALKYGFPMIDRSLLITD